MKRSEKKLGAILVDSGVITETQLEDALEEQKITKEYLGAILVNKQYASETNILKALALQFNLPVISVKNIKIDWNLTKQFSPSLVLQDKCFPIKKEEFSITVAIINPLDAFVLKRAEDESRGLRVRFVLVSLADMEELIRQYKQFMRGIVFGKLE